ncbi:hypothetical protein CC1G_08794 [Coprinopsis cinerea okayama7|uniref:AB hydrolase-1 domain-containing protein n=1 Tax=Coprinopsis cinerea (strain Okayama-7 / 130 / ATCC MYA-4618 / FGSC 9003) TaxID=240176 RepID=A8N444_COPC7|nr:hypothetical protein CC1G_08794 [Coprinopsis cinerea okayama7\|eukprot:XP_001829639.2 hypothetical protein CC1G_08794 [Coprinopsis cinerea okayama7\
MGLRTESHSFSTPSFTTRDGDTNTRELWMTAKRYTMGASAANPAGVTLLFTHCVGSHKEEWEVVIEILFRLNAGQDPAYQIREAWSFDRQNHGDAAVLNREKLDAQGVSLYEWSAALSAFVKSPYMAGHHMVAIGHSAGSTAWVLTTIGSFSDDKNLPYVAMIPVESTMVKQSVFESELEERMSYMDLVVNATKARRDRWSSRQEAYAYFKKRFPWSMWDDRSIQLLVDHGLCDAPNGQGVQLKCPKEQEAVSYPDTKPHFEGDTQLGKISRSVPIHIIWGERIEFM